MFLRFGFIVFEEIADAQSALTQTMHWIGNKQVNVGPVHEKKRVQVFPDNNNNNNNNNDNVNTTETNTTTNDVEPQNMQEDKEEKKKTSRSRSYR